MIPPNEQDGVDRKWTISGTSHDVHGFGLFIEKFVLCVRTST